MHSADYFGCRVAANRGSFMHLALYAFTADTDEASKFVKEST